ncbi:MULTISPECIES: hypothetical protein [Saliphagus]|uniref:C2H2-type domain-containing protein n=1 Tax=Saliphagus infecundisoli TaxID=1849069 RepID=A0ABD5QAP4_9EURY|nr:MULTISPECIES: hypothetical protein [Saliphagus]
MYQQCPFCDRVFEIGETDYRPMKAHIRARHADSDEGGAGAPTVKSASRGSAAD